MLIIVYNINHAVAQRKRSFKEIKMQTFSYSRYIPTNVLTVEANFNLVQVGGGSLSTLREDFFDQAIGAYTPRCPQIVSAYDIALSGGEPYSLWV
jgi:hypothetical protein